MPCKHFIIGTAGHIDHGKSTLVEALTGTDPDRLPEEKARGMTIDLGFAHLDLPDPSDANRIFSLGIVDVPGHADFVKNMVAGVGSIDLALVIVAADDGWMPQTEEHVQILGYLGVPSAVVALTKSDLLTDRKSAIDDVRAHLEGTLFQKAPIIPVCALGGEGLDELTRAMVSVLRGQAPQADIGKPRLHVDRAFSPRGVGTVVTGTLTGGRLRKGAAVVVQPEGNRTAIRNIQSHNANIDEAFPGMRTAINLSDIGVGKHERKSIRRGDVVTLPHLGQLSRIMDVFIERCSREVAGQRATTKPIKNGQRVRWHHGAASHSARIYFLGKRALAPGEKGFAQLRFERPVYAYCGDRFVIRDWPKTSSLAGGTVLDEKAGAKRFRTEAQAAFLEARSKAPRDVQTALVSLLQRDKAVESGDVLRQSCLSEESVEEQVAALKEAGQLAVAGHWLVDSSWWNALQDEMGKAIWEFHEKHPDQAGLPLSELRLLAGSRVPHTSLVDAVFESLTNGAFQRVGTALRHGSHRPSLPPALRMAGDRILRSLADRPLEPPNPKELAPSPGDQKALRFLMEMGEVMDLGPKCALLSETFESAKATVIAYIKAKQRATVSELRQEVGTSRRVLMPILERMDKENITIRTDDFRSLSRSYLRNHGEEKG